MIDQEVVQKAKEAVNQGKQLTFGQIGFVDEFLSNNVKKELREESIARDVKND